MNNIIKFSEANKVNRREPPTYVATSVDTQGIPPNDRIDFTCVNCHNQLHLKVDNAIFKNIELFCIKCGSGWKITNPMFATKRTKNG